MITEDRPSKTRYVWHVDRGHMVVKVPGSQILGSEIAGDGWYDWACGKAPTRISSHTLGKRMPSVPSRVTCKLCRRTRVFKARLKMEKRR